MKRNELHYWAGAIAAIGTAVLATTTTGAHLIPEPYDRYVALVTVMAGTLAGYGITRPSRAPKSEEPEA